MCTHKCTQPRVLIIRCMIRSLWFNMLKAFKCSFLHLKAYPLIKRKHTQKNKKNKNKNPHFSKDSNFYSILISVSTVLPVYTGMCTAPGSFITFLETADVWLCSPGDHLKSFKLPEDRCFFYSPLSRKSASTVKDLSWFITSIPNTFNASVIQVSWGSTNRVWVFDWSFYLTYGLDGLAKLLLELLSIS